LIADPGVVVMTALPLSPVRTVVPTGRLSPWVRGEKEVEPGDADSASPET
jgi:hypothetical protein